MANISVRTKVLNNKRLFLYNYNNNVLVPRNHPVLIRCRGLVLDENGIVVTYPFDRFFNDYEREVAHLDWDTTQVLEKVDGTLICLSYHDNIWLITTRGSFYPLEVKGKDLINYEDLFKKHFPIFKDNLLPLNSTMMFELVTKKNRIVTWYEEDFVTLIGARNNITFKEWTQEQLDELALNINVKRPKKFYAKNLKESKILFDVLRDDEEGLVIIDHYSNRIKLKQESYFKLTKLKMLNNEDLFDYVLGRINLDFEFLEKLPEVNQEIKLMKEAWQLLQINIQATFEQIKESNTRKEFAIKALNYRYHAFLFALLDGKDILPKIRWNYVKNCLY
ncbi:MAG: RNA ligase [Candidatus Hodarchaeales archaeon]